MRSSHGMVRFATALVLFCTKNLYAADTGPRTYDAAFFNQFAPQTALEMVVRIPGFVLSEADDDRGLSQGGTNILINQQPIIGKGETATTQIGQVAAANVIRIEIIDAGTLDLPGFNGLVANIVTRQDVIAGALQWRPAWRRDNEPELLNGQINASGSVGDLEFTTAFSNSGQSQIRGSGSRRGCCGERIRATRRTSINRWQPAGIFRQHPMDNRQPTRPERQRFRNAARP
ncbi:MAG: hypothetical protein AAGL69_03805 [Pseudomonadota bacterium]